MDFIADRSTSLRADGLIGALARFLELVGTVEIIVKRSKRSVRAETGGKRQGESKSKKSKCSRAARKIGERAERVNEKKPIQLVVEKNAPEVKEPKDFAEARKEIATLVRKSAIEIALEFIARAKAGEVGPAKYLFEAVGLYPATEEPSSKPEDSLAYTLLKRMGLPTDPVNFEEEPLPVSKSGQDEPKQVEETEDAVE